MPKFNTCYTTNDSRYRKEFKKESLTEQSFKEECSLSYLVEMYKRTGQPLPVATAQYGDTTTVMEFERAMQLVAEAKSNFECLPSSVRDEFQTVQNYLAFVSNPDNIRECYERGLVDPSSVDLTQVYPERYAQPETTVKEDAKTLSEDISVKSSETSKEISS